MKGAIPVAYIVALILGVAVIGLLGYWFFVQGGIFEEQMTTQTCIAKKLSYCTQWQARGYEIKDHKYLLERGDLKCKTSSPKWGDNDRDWKCFAPGCTDLGVVGPSDSVDCQLSG